MTYHFDVFDQRNALQWAYARMPDPHLLFIDPAVFALRSPKGEYVAVLVFDAFDYARGSCRYSAVVDDHKAVTRRVIRLMFKFSFVEMGMRRIEVEISADNQDSLRAAERLGFKRVGTRRAMGTDGVADLIVFDMLRDECPWLRGGKD